MIVVRQDEVLLQRINLIDVLHVDDEALSNTHEDMAVGAELARQHFFHFTQIHAYGSTQLVDHHNVSIVAVSLEIHNL